MKDRIRQLIDTYRDMIKRSRSQRSIDILQNVIEDLETVLREAQ
jgi:hypothetical protein